MKKCASKSKMPSKKVMAKVEKSKADKKADMALAKKMVKGKKK